MWPWRRRDAVDTTSTVRQRCHGTLVVHADGGLDCSEESCGAQVDFHDWWLPCIDLVVNCGCAGDEQPIEPAARAA